MPWCRGERANFVAAVVPLSFLAYLAWPRNSSLFLGLKSNDSRQYSVASTNYPLTAVVHHNSPQPTPTHPHDYGVSTHARAY